MSGLGTLALVLATIWLAALTMVALVLVREVAVLRFHQGQRTRASAPARQGLDIGRDLPPLVRELVPETSTGVVYVILTSAICAPCRELVTQLRQLKIDEPVVALVAGRSDVAEDLVAMFPPYVRVVRDPLATTLADALELRTTPFAMELEFGQVTGKAFLHEASHLMNLIRARRTGLRKLVRQPEVSVNVG